MKRRLSSLLPLLLLCLAAAGLVAQQQAPGPDPLVKENGTVKVAPHTYAIPDDNAPVVPNVGIVVGSRATLVIDPGAGRVNGERVLREVAKVSKNTEVYVAATHWHTEHTTGVNGFPATAKFIANKIQVGEMAEGMTAAGGKLLEALACDGRNPEGRDGADGGDHLRRHLHAGSRRRDGELHRRRARRTRAATRASTCAKTACCSAATW